jgi:divalent metal cation (Fe/Co/Zn/Cd) transporter
MTSHKVSGGGKSKTVAVQTEIPIPTQPLRITLHKARAIRDQLEKQLQKERPNLATDVTAIALQFRGAEVIYRSIRPSFYRKRTLDQLRTLGCFIAALERKR